MHFNPLKGAAYTMQQVDKVAPVATDVTGIERGSCVKVIVEDGITKFTKCGAADAGTTTAPGAQIYFALQNQNNTQVTTPGGSMGGLGAMLCSPMLGEVETDMYDTSAGLVVGDFLTCGADGKLTKHADGNTCVGKVTKAPMARWSNEAWAIVNQRTGANINVIAFQALYQPGMRNA